MPAWRQRKRSPARAAARRLSSRGALSAALGRRMPKASVSAATAKVARSKAITPGRPAKPSTAAASAGVARFTTEEDSARKEAARWNCARGVSSVVVTSEAGCCTLFIRPLSALSA